MNPPIGLITPVKAAFGAWLGEFYAQFYADTRANVEWAARGLSTAMAWVPGRMVDSVEDMISSHRTNDNSGRAATSAFVPVVFVAVANEYAETPAEAGMPISDPLPICLPGDPLERSFRVRTMGADLRAQVAVVCSEVASAQSIVAQLFLWARERPKFRSTYTFEGFASQWPVQVLGVDKTAIPSPVGEHLSILTVDFTLRATMPMITGPGAGDVPDGNTPPGFEVVAEVAATGLAADPRRTNPDPDCTGAGIVLYGIDNEPGGPHP